MTVQTLIYDQKKSFTECKDVVFGIYFIQFQWTSSSLSVVDVISRLTVKLSYYIDAIFKKAEKFSKNIVLDQNEHPLKKPLKIVI